MNDTGPHLGNRNRTKKSQNLKSSSELTYRMYKLCKLLLACTFQNHYDELISRHCLDKTRTRWNDFLFLITDDHDFRPQTCTNGLVFRECRHIKNLFLAFAKKLFHVCFTLKIINCNEFHSDLNQFIRKTGQKY
jgi:hypothetical protein